MQSFSGKTAKRCEHQNTFDDRHDIRSDWLFGRLSVTLGSWNLSLFVALGVISRVKDTLTFWWVQHFVRWFYTIYLVQAGMALNWVRFYKVFVSYCQSLRRRVCARNIATKATTASPIRPTTSFDDLTWQRSHEFTVGDKQWECTFGCTCASFDNRR